MTPRAAIFGASGGIGAAFVRALLARGFAVHAGSRSGADVGATDVGGAKGFAFDLADEASIAAAAAGIGAPLDLVIVATGVLQDKDAGIVPERSWRAIDPAAMAQVFAINTIGPALIAKHFLPLLRPDARSVFAALSARVGSIGDNRLGGWHAYRASKAALNQLVHTCGIELARKWPAAIAVCLHPGTVATGLSEPFQRGVPESQLFDADFCAARLLAVLDGLTPADSGGFFAWDGEAVVW